jgi:hypothetical protein
MLVWCPFAFTLDKTNVTNFEDLKNYKDPEKVYEDGEFLAGALNFIEERKADLHNIYTNYLPFYSQIITYTQNSDRKTQSDFIELLSSDIPDQSDVSTLSPADSETTTEVLNAADNPDDLSDAAETEPPEIKIEARMLLDDNFHRYYDFEPYQFLDRYILNPNDQLRKPFDRQVANLNRIIASNTDVNFYVYVCTRMQDTEFSKEIVPQEFSTLDYFNEFIGSVKGATDIGWFDIDTVDKRIERVFRTDHHWSALGAYSGYTDVVNMMKKYTPEVGEPLPLNGETGLITFDDVEMRGSFASTMRFDDYYETFKVLDITLPEFIRNGMHSDAYARYSTGGFDKSTFADHYGAYYNAGSVRRYKVKNSPNGRNLLIIGDSYTWWFSWMIAANYENVHIYRPPWDTKDFDYNKYIEENNITDVLLMQFSDRLFFNYYSDSNLSVIKT